MDAPGDKMLCYCRNVRYGEVRASIERTDAKSVAQVMVDCTAGTGCRTCHPEIEELIQEHRSRRSGGGLWSALKRLFRA